MRFRSRHILLTGFFALNTLAAFGSTLDVVFFDNRFGTLNDLTGAYTPMGTLPISASAGIASMNGLLYLEDLGTDLYTVNPYTGTSSLVGGTGLTDRAGAFAGDSTGLYEVDYASNLYSINASTGKATLVGATGLIANNGRFDTSLSAIGSYLYYTAGASGANDELYRVNVTTGVATDLGSTGVTGIAGSAMVGSNLELYQYGQGTNYIYSAPAGATSFVRQSQLAAQIVDGGAVFSTSGNAQASAVSEPAASLLLIVGLVLVFARVAGRISRS